MGRCKFMKPSKRKGDDAEQCKLAVSVKHQEVSEFCRHHRCEYTDGGQLCGNQIFVCAAGNGAYRFCDQHCCQAMDNGDARCQEKAVVAGGTLCFGHKPQAEPPPLEECILCREDKPLTQGIFCKGSDPHFTCDPCFSKWVADRCEPAQRGRLLEHNFLIYCSMAPPAGQCDACYPAAQRGFNRGDIANHAEADLTGLDRYVQALMDHAARQAEAEANARARVEAIAAELARLNLDPNGEQRAAAIRLRVTGEALVLRTPCCHIAWHWPLDECAAITCNSCNHAFCGLCLKDFGVIEAEEIDDANTQCHDHLVEDRCPLQPDNNYFATPDTRDNAERVVRIQQVQQLLVECGAGLNNPRLRDAVLQPLAPSLRDVGLNLQDFVVVGTVPSPGQVLEQIRSSAGGRLLLSDLYARHRACLMQGRQSQRLFLAALLLVGRVILHVEDLQQEPRVYVVVKDVVAQEGGGTQGAGGTSEDPGDQAG
eukprot:CAMPEP_0119104122 /NCGR_PEP_ID=MMETSP1180-20130426/2413_1 /TAXON_ID=3052 ORGANISM="Chlamydomonas cf sp, Strain CCMP681" /NCGR_SAMPLE_ID=MMETSP1180 /ASSEMBLY_ACC=CAM_ASM_000741 /LENGTH=481 /DNA_ID=CAMNT_0007088799 /DNA_START=73 /DNA_END=1515 /DNA_ORIENTATION=-